MPVRQFLALIAIILVVLVSTTVAVPLLGSLGSFAKDSAGSNGEGFSVSDDTIDDSAHIAIVQVPAATIVVVGAWAFLSLLAVLAALGGL